MENDIIGYRIGKQGHVIKIMRPGIARGVIALCTTPTVRRLPRPLHLQVNDDDGNRTRGSVARNRHFYK